jgi:hypothetical protein
MSTAEQNNKKKQNKKKNSKTKQTKHDKSSGKAEKNGGPKEGLG